MYHLSQASPLPGSTTQTTSCPLTWLLPSRRHGRPSLLSKSPALPTDRAKLYYIAHAEPAGLL
ncbi:hypothetical protein BJX65DRAFT_288584 [Aspergillus insuetus]